MDKEELIKGKRATIKELPKLQKISRYLLATSLVSFILGIIEYFGITPVKFTLIPIVILDMILMAVLHELAHGIMFKIYSGTIKFGFALKSRLGVLFYVRSPGLILSKRKYILVAIAPQFITIVIVILSILLAQVLETWLSNLLLMSAAFNLAGGYCDLYLVVYLITKLKGEVFVEDTKEGVIIYRRDG